jgi:uncharacterized protein Smg (DUF494 family)
VNRKIVDLLVQVLQWIGEGQQDQADIQAMIEDLLQSGFEQSDIQMVLNWVQDRLSTAGLVYQAAPAVVPQPAGAAFDGIQYHPPGPAAFPA